MEAFLKFILITVVVFWLLGLLGRVALKRWIQKKQREFTGQFGGSGNASYGQYTYGSGQRSKQTKREGEVSVQRTERQQKKVSRNVGDYVEYEEEVEVEETKNINS